MTGNASNLIVLADQNDRPAWLAARQTGLGGSDIAAICGEHKYRTAIDVWTDHVDPGLSENLTSSGADAEFMDRVDMGTMLEPFVLEQVAAGKWKDRTPRFIWRPPLVGCKDFPLHIGSADGLALDAGPAFYNPTRDHRFTTVLDVDNLSPLPTADGTPRWWDAVEECKTHGWRGADDYDAHSDEPVPPDKVIQGTWYGGLWKVPVVRLSALIDTHQRRFWRWKVDPELVADLRQMAEDWWNKHIIGGITPDPDGSERFSKYLRRKWTGDAGTVVLPNEELRAILVRFRDAKLAAKAADIEVDRYTQIVKASMGDASILDGGKDLGKIHWKCEAQGRLKHRAALEDLYERIGMSTAERTEHEDKHRGEEPARPFRTPQKWTK